MSIWFTHASPWRVIADDRDSNPLWWCSTARSVRRNHFSRHHGDRNGKQKPTPALQHLEPGRLLLGEHTSEGQQGCGPTGRTARIGLQAIQQHLPKALDFIVVRCFRWPCYQIQVDTPVDVWSNHACQVALFFPSIHTACSSRSVRSCPASALLAQVGGSVNTRSSPASGNAPLGNQGST